MMLAVYIVLILIFLVMSALIVRHTVKYGYLSQKFKSIVTIFGLIALGVIVFSLYMMISLFTGSSPSSSPSVKTVNSGEINF